MYSIYDQINNRKVLIYPERQTEIKKTTDLVTLSNEQIASTYFPEDIDPIPPDFKKVEIGDGNFIYHGSNIDVLKTLPDNSIDSCVTDPPYGLKFMGKNWDEDVPSIELWKEVYRVLKPGGHVLSFGSPKTYHRMVTRIEDAGFEIRDQIMWVYGTGFPKSHNISKAIDKKYGRIGLDLTEIKFKLKDLYISSGKTMKKIDDECGFRASGYLRVEHRDDDGWGESLPTVERWLKISEVINCGREKFEELKSYLENAERETIGIGKAGFLEKNHVFNLNKKDYGNYNITKSNTPEGKTWEGWGTGLKPAHEPIVMARKPFKGSIVENLLKWDTGGINIDDCRIDIRDEKVSRLNIPYEHKSNNNFGDGKDNRYGTITMSQNNVEGRFPANIIFDEVAGEILDLQSGVLNKQCKCKTDNKSGFQDSYVGGKISKPIERLIYTDIGGASRFFYCPKPSKKEKEEGLTNEKFDIKLRKLQKRRNTHTTVKPTKLIQYLIRLVTPIGGKTIDPFFGSGTSGKSAIIEENYKFIGIEKEKEYFDIATERCKYEFEKTLKVAA